MAINVGELEVKATADTRDASLGISGISEELRSLQRDAQRSRQGVAAVATSLTAVAGEASTAAGSVARFANQMVGAFATGGAIGIGIGAAVGGFQTLASAIRSTAQDADQLRALDYVLGIGKEQVDDLRHRFRTLGTDISQRVAVEIMQVGREAGYSAEEIAKMAAEIRNLAVLQGGNATQAAKAFFAASKSGADDFIDRLRQIVQHRKDALAGVAGEERQAEEELEEIARERQKLAERKQQAEQRSVSVLGEIERLEARIADHQRRFGEVDIGAKRELWQKQVKDLWQEHEQLKIQLDGVTSSAAALASREEQINNLTREAVELTRQLAEEEKRRREEEERQRETRRRAVEVARREQERAENSASLLHRVRLLESQMAEDRKAELRELAEEEIRLQQDAADRGRVTREAADEWERARRAQLAKDLQEIDDEVAASERARQLDIQLMRARGANDQVEIARIAADREIAEEERKVDGLIYTQEEFAQWRRAREEQLAGEISRIREAELREHKRQQERMARETERRLADEERMQVAGINAGFAFVSGFKRAIDSDDPGAWLGALLTGAGAIASLVPGGQVPGAVLGGFGGLFHEGGMVGIGGQPLPRYHSGGMIIAHRGLMLPEPGPGEVPIMAQTGEAVLSRLGVAALGGPGAVQALNEGRAPAQSGTTNIYIQAFDPRSTEDALASVWEPAEYRRGMSRQDAKVTALQRRRLGTPRAGR